jgi:hypothetical protein
MQRNQQPMVVQWAVRSGLKRHTLLHARGSSAVAGSP